MTFLQIIFFIVAFLLIVVTLLQGGKSEGASGAIMGGSLNVFSNTKERGPEVIMVKITVVLGIIFFALAILIKILS